MSKIMNLNLNLLETLIDEHERIILNNDKKLF